MKIAEEKNLGNTCLMDSKRWEGWIQLSIMTFNISWPSVLPQFGFETGDVMEAYLSADGYFLIYLQGQPGYSTDIY